MKKLKIAVPKKGNKWKISFNGDNPFSRSTAAAAYNLVERKILNSLRTWAKEKTLIHVNYDQVHLVDDKGLENKGIYDSIYEALYVLACFLEDYISLEFAGSKYKKYFPKFTGEKYL